MNRIQKYNSGTLKSTNKNTHIGNSFITNLGYINYKQITISNNLLLDNKTNYHIMLDLSKNSITLKFKTNINDGKTYIFHVVKSRNTSITENTIFEENGENFISNINIPKDFFLEVNTLNISFEYSLKYVGLLEECNDIPNAIVKGYFVIEYNEKNEITPYIITNYTILDITYNSNDFCSSYLSPNYFYDKYCDELDNEECIESNIWQVFDNMLKNIIIKYNDDNITLNFTIYNFHSKIKNIIGEYIYTYICPSKYLTIDFSNLLSKSVIINSITNSGLEKKILSNSDKTVVENSLFIGDRISVTVASLNNIFVEMTKSY